MVALHFHRAYVNFQKIVFLQPIFTVEVDYLCIRATDCPLSLKYFIALTIVSSTTTGLSFTGASKG